MLSNKILKFVVLVLLLTSLAVFSGCGGGESPGYTTPPIPPEPEPIETIIPDTTKVVGEETIQEIVSVTEDQSTIIFEKSTSQIEELAPGDIIVMGVTKNTPEGLLRKVTNITKGGKNSGEVIVETEFATLEEAIEQGEFSFNETLKAEDAKEPIYYVEGIEFIRDKSKIKDSKMQLFEFNFNINSIIYDADNNPNTKEDNITLTGQIAFNYNLLFSGKIGFPHLLKELNFQNIVEIEKKLGVTVGGPVKLFSQKIDLYTHDCGIKTVLIGGWFPVVLHPIITVSANVDGEIFAKATVEITDGDTYTAGVKFDNGNWYPISSYENNFSPPLLSFSTGGSITFGVGPKLECRVDGVLGPNCETTLYGRAVADIYINPWWKLYVGIIAKAGVNIKIFSKVYASADLTVLDLKKIIAQADGPFGGTNHAPVISSLTANPPSIDINQTTTITCTASDQDEGDTLDYNWSKNGGTFEGSTSGSSVTWSAPSTADTYTVSCEVSDGKEEDNKSVDISVSNITPTNQPPSIPNNPSPVSGSTSISINTNLSWIGGDPDPEDTVTYDVYFKANDSSPDILVSSDQNSTIYIPGILNYDTHYYWKIVAKDNHGKETPGPVWNFITESQINNPPNLPNTPSGPSSGTINTTYFFSTSTTDPNGDNIAYKFDWGDGNISNWTSYVSSGNSISQLHSYSTKGTYYIKAKAKDINGAESEWSNSHKIIIDLEITKPAAPSKLSATTLSQNNIALVWQDNSDNETGFKIERKTGTAGTFIQRATIGATTGSGSGVYYEDSGLTAGTSYCYRVRAYNSAGNSSYSNEYCSTTKPIETLPSATTGSATNITFNSAKLNGTVNPNGVTTGAFFQWGIDTSYGNLTDSQLLGSGTSNVNISANLTGLSPNTIYHFRIVATNSAGGTTYGEDRVFTTYKKVTIANTSSIGLKLHNSPDKDSPVIIGLIEGTQMSVIGGPVQANGYTWWNIKGIVGGVLKEGWSAIGEWLTPITPQINSTVTVTYTGGYGLRLRSGAGLNYSIITTLPEGTQMTVFGGPIQKDGYTWWALQGYVGGVLRTGWSPVGNWLVPNPQ